MSSSCIFIDHCLLFTSVSCQGSLQRGCVTQRAVGGCVSRCHRWFIVRCCYCNQRNIIARNCLAQTLSLEVNITTFYTLFFKFIQMNLKKNQKSCRVYSFDNYIIFIIALIQPHIMCESSSEISMYLELCAIITRASKRKVLRTAFVFSVHLQLSKYPFSLAKYAFPLQFEKCWRDLAL